MAGLLWAAGLCAGFGNMWRYETTPGLPADPPARWPENTRLERQRGRPTLVMLAHPRCPCTRASLVELNALVAQIHEPVSAYVLVVQPLDAAEDWSEPLAAAESIPGVRTVIDRGGVEARRFRARTSGQMIAYDAAGRLLFSGGITAARGHEGDNAGSQRLRALLDGFTPDRADSAVFGCELLDPERGGT